MAVASVAPGSCGGVARVLAQLALTMRRKDWAQHAGARQGARTHLRHDTCHMSQCSPPPRVPHTSAATAEGFSEKSEREHVSDVKKTLDFSPQVSKTRETTTAVKMSRWAT